jgi:hypothetical protein
MLIATGDVRILAEPYIYTWRLPGAIPVSSMVLHVVFAKSKSLSGTIFWSWDAKPEKIVDTQNNMEAVTSTEQTTSAEKAGVIKGLRRVNDGADDHRCRPYTSPFTRIVSTYTRDAKSLVWSFSHLLFSFIARGCLMLVRLEGTWQIQMMLLISC